MNFTVKFDFVLNHVDGAIMYRCQCFGMFRGDMVPQPGNQFEVNICKDDPESLEVDEVTHTAKGGQVKHHVVLEDCEIELEDNDVLSEQIEQFENVMVPLLREQGFTQFSPVDPEPEND